MSGRKKQDLLNGIKKPYLTAKLIACSTLHIEYCNKTIAIRYHDTDVITFGNNYIILNSGGFRTKTTKKRINQHLGHLQFSAYARNGSWFVKTPKGVYEFYDGIIFDVHGTLISEEKKSDKK